MAEYTIELRDVVKYYNIFGFEYPTHDEKKRREFEQAFIRHFYFREICCAEPERFIHYLEDKFITVWPYYNELLRTATIDYDIENPYKLTETYTRKADNVDKTAGFASSVGTGSEQTTAKTSETAHGKTDNTASSATSRNEKNTAKADDKTDESSESRNLKKYLELPEGKLNLDDPDYLTNLTQDEAKGESSRKSERSETRDITGGESTKQDSSSNSEDLREGSTDTEHKQQSTADSNTRSETVGTRTEEYVLERKGNIGVNPASHEIDMHIITQKTLKRIYELFFNECEDLFMMVL